MGFGLRWDSGRAVDRVLGPKIGYDITDDIILAETAQISHFTPKNSRNSTKYPQQYLEGHKNGKGYVKNAELPCNWVYIGVVLVIFRI